MSDEFYVHEDDWGMIELSPREIGWTDIMVAPEVEVKLVTRQITLAALVDVLGPGGGGVAA